jgi:hypothetical protein
VVSVEEGKQLAKEYGIGFFETSAKNDIEVDTVCAFFHSPSFPCARSLGLCSAALACDCASERTR